MREKDGPTSDAPASAYVRVSDVPSNTVCASSVESEYPVHRPPPLAVSDSQGTVFQGSESVGWKSARPYSPRARPGPRLT